MIDAELFGDNHSCFYKIYFLDKILFLIETTNKQEEKIEIVRKTITDHKTEFHLN